VNKIIIIVLLIIIAGIGYFFANTNYQKGVPTISKPDITISSGPANVASQNIEIKNFTFIPEKITIKKGTKVVWTNKDNAPHQIVSDQSVFKGNVLQEGENYSFTFTNSGTYTYNCGIHPNMKGEILVEKQ